MTGFAAKKATKLLKLICRNVLLVRTTTILFVKADEIFAAPQNAELEMKKAASFRSIKRKIRKKQIFVVVLAFAIFAVVSFSIVGLLKKSEQVISYEDNISVSMVDDSLIGRLQGNQANYLKIKQVEIENNGQKDTYLFFLSVGNKVGRYSYKR